MAVQTYTRVSDGAKVTVDTNHLTTAIAKRLNNPVKPELPTAIKNKAKKDKDA